jgi:hypothetical protein
MAGNPPAAEAERPKAKRRSEAPAGASPPATPPTPPPTEPSVEGEAGPGT